MLSAKVLSDMFDLEKGFSWIVSTSGFVSWIGSKLHHPNEKIRLTTKEARTFLKIVEEEIQQHKASLEALITNFTEAKNANLTLQSLNLKHLKNLSDHIAYGKHNNRATYDIEKYLRARTYLANERNNVFLTNEQISSDIRKEPFSEQHLPLIRPYWQLLRVQYNILSIQVRAAENSDKPSYSKALEKLQGCDEGQEKLFCPAEQLEFNTFERKSQKQCSRSLQSSWTSLSTMEEVNDTADERNPDKAKFPSDLAENSRRDDGYYSSKAGESATEEACSLTDTQSVETDGALAQEEVEETRQKKTFMVSKRPMLDETEVSHEVFANFFSSPQEHNVFMVPKSPLQEETEVSHDLITPSSSSKELNVFMVPKKPVLDDKKVYETKHHVTFLDPEASPKKMYETTNDSASTPPSSPEPDIAAKSDYDDINNPISSTTKPNNETRHDVFMSPSSSTERKLASERDANVMTEEWTELIRIVDRFSENTISLISWIDELNEVMHDESFSPKFFRSQSSRERTVTHHVERLYFEVIEDASTLLRSLPSERETLMTVLRNIEAQCCKVGIFATDDINELSSIKATKWNDDRKCGFLSPELKRVIFPPVSVSEELRNLETASRGQSSFLQSYEHFVPPAVSTPKIGNKKRDHFDDATTSLHNYHPTPIRSKGYDPLRHSIYGYCDDRFLSESYTARRRWIDFSSEYQPVLEWLQMMETLINRAETSKLPIYDVEHLFQKYLRQFEDHKVRREDLITKAKYLEETHPELQQKIRIRMSDLDDLWNALFCRLTCYTTPLPFHRDYLRSEILERYDTILDRCDTLLPLEYYRDRYDTLFPIEYYRYFGHHRINYLDILEWSRLLPFFDHNVQLSDFSYHQIRDRLYLGKPRSRWEKRMTYERRGSSETGSSFDPMDDRQIRSEELADTSCNSSYEPRWTAFEGMESELDRNRSCRDRWNSPFLIPRRTMQDKAIRETPPRDISKTISREAKREKEVKDVEEMIDAMSEKMTMFDLIEERMSPLEVSDCIHSFHHWLKLIEEDAYEKSGIGWKKERVQKLLDANEDRMIKLDEKNRKLEKIVLASQKLLNNHRREVSEFCLMWAFWMLEQRYYNLVLHALDMDCILDRRAAFIRKGSEERIPHPKEGLWSDNGEDMRPTVETYDKDYDILWAF